MKTCCTCKREFPNTEEFFHRNGKYLRSECKACSSIRTKAWQRKNEARNKANKVRWRAENRERYQQTNREWRARNPGRSAEVSRNKYLRRKYGLDQTQLETMVAAQNGECANPGCTTPVASGGSSSHIDHDHKTGKIRGVLCQKCNQALGLLDEDKARIQGLVQYLEVA